MWADEGFVPWAESGMRTYFRALPRASCAARMIIMPVSSPCAPADGCSVIASIPAISDKLSARVLRISRFPCASSAGAPGWIPARRGFAASFSLTLGLYFMVQEPRG